MCDGAKEKNTARSLLLELQPAAAERTILGEGSRLTPVQEMPEARGGGVAVPLRREGHRSAVGQGLRDDPAERPSRVLLRTRGPGLERMCRLQSMLGTSASPNATHFGPIKIKGALSATRDGSTGLRSAQTDGGSMTLTVLWHRFGQPTNGLRFTTHDSRLTVHPIVSAINAFCTWSRFSASS